MSSNAARKTEQENEALTLWFVARGTVLKGPYTTHELDSSLHRKEVTFMDFCWRQGFREWRPIASVDEFERRGIRVQSPLYPTIEVPAGNTDLLLNPTRANERRYLDRRQNSRATKKIQLALGGTRRRTFSVYEWAFAVIFAVMLCYGGVHMALTDVEEKLTLKIELLTLGLPQVFDNHSFNYAPEVWAPIYSAPGLQYFSQDIAVPPDHKDIDLLPINLQGSPQLSEAPQSVTVGAYKVTSPVPLAYWSASDKHADPVYVKPVVIRGHLSLKNAFEVTVQPHGEPYLP